MGVVASRSNAKTAEASRFTPAQKAVLDAEGSGGDCLKDRVRRLGQEGEKRTLSFHDGAARAISGDEQFSVRLLRGRVAALAMVRDTSSFVIGWQHWNPASLVLQSHGWCLCWSKGLPASFTFTKESPQQNLYALYNYCDRRESALMHPSLLPDKTDPVDHAEQTYPSSPRSVQIKCFPDCHCHRMRPPRACPCGSLAALARHPLCNLLPSDSGRGEAAYRRVQSVGASGRLRRRGCGSWSSSRPWSSCGRRGRRGVVVVGCLRG